MITKQHYKAIAEIIKKAVPDYDTGNWCCGDNYAGAQHAQAAIHDGLADYFATDNPRFDRKRFMAACGLE